MDVKHCPSCGRPSPFEARYCTSCGRELGIINSRPQKRKNRYDEGVKEWFASKTFKTLLTIGLIGGCCFATCSFLYYGSLVGLLSSLLSPPPEYQSAIATPTHRPLIALTQLALQQPHIAGKTDESNPIDEKTKDIINNWLISYQPVHTPYWFVTAWNREEDDRVFVSLAAVRLSSPDETWHLTGEPNGDNKVLWIGSVIVSENRVELYQP